MLTMALAGSVTVGVSMGFLIDVVVAVDDSSWAAAIIIVDAAARRAVNLM